MSFHGFTQTTSQRALSFSLSRLPLQKISRGLQLKSIFSVAALMGLFSHATHACMYAGMYLCAHALHVNVFIQFLYMRKPINHVLHL